MGIQDVPQGYREWPIVAVEDFYGQQRHDAPEEYGTVVTYRDPTTGTVVIEQTCVQPHDWREAPYGPATCRPAGERVTAWVAR